MYRFVTRWTMTIVLSVLVLLPAIIATTPTTVVAEKAGATCHAHGGLCCRCPNLENPCSEVSYNGHVECTQTLCEQQMCWVP